MTHLGIRKVIFRKPAYVSMTDDDCYDIDGFDGGGGHERCQGNCGVKFE